MVTACRRHKSATVQIQPTFHLRFSLLWHWEILKVFKSALATKGGFQERFYEVFVYMSLKIRWNGLFRFVRKKEKQCR